MEYARITSRHFGTSAHEYYVTAQDVLDTLPIVARAYDEPFGNASAIPTYLCAKMARDSGVHVMLAGDGGDEIFGGNARYAKQKVFESYGIVPGVLRRALIEPLVLGHAGRRLRFRRCASSGATFDKPGFPCPTAWRHTIFSSDPP